MTLSERINPLRPYFQAIKLGIGAALVLAMFVGGCRHGRAVERGTHADEVQGYINQIGLLNGQVITAQAALNAQNEAAEQAIEDARRVEHASGVAAEVLADQTARMHREANNYALLIRSVRESKPSCKTLLEMDLKKECGL